MPWLLCRHLVFIWYSVPAVRVCMAFISSPVAKARLAETSNVDTLYCLNNHLCYLSNKYSLVHHISGFHWKTFFFVVTNFLFYEFTSDFPLEHLCFSTSHFTHPSSLEIQDTLQFETKSRSHLGHM